ncbi:MAG: hypothetical protein NC912_03860 [Candidatus Omnitrophica bacterium]|nr:hypothetical protein [Candidatus Omnitrophota bacterium]
MSNLLILLFWVVLVIWSILDSKGKRASKKDRKIWPEKVRNLPEKKIESEEKKISVKTTNFSPESQKIPLEKVEIKKEPETDYLNLLSEDKLQEGIILSLILGPPKAYNLLPATYMRKRV